MELLYGNVQKCLGYKCWHKPTLYSHCISTPLMCLLSQSWLLHRTLSNIYWREPTPICKGCSHKPLPNFLLLALTIHCTPLKLVAPDLLSIYAIYTLGYKFKRCRWSNCDRAIRIIRPQYNWHIPSVGLLYWPWILVVPFTVHGLVIYWRSNFYVKLYIHYCTLLYLQIRFLYNYFLRIYSLPTGVLCSCWLRLRG